MYVFNLKGWKLKDCWMFWFTDTDGSWIFVNEGKSTLDIAISFDFRTD